MTAKWIAVFWLAAPLFGQFSFYAVNGGVEQLADTSYFLGNAGTGDSLAQRLRLKNTSTASASVALLSISGDGFVLKDVPRLPQTVSPGQFVEFTVGFQGDGIGSYSANLKADHLSLIVQASVSASVTVSVEEGSTRRVLPSGATVDYGNVERGATALRRFTLTNGTRQVMVPAVRLSGPGFSLDTSGPAAQLAPGAAISFGVICAPAAGGPVTGSLQIDQRQIILQANAVDPPLPRPEILVDLASATSGQQGRLTVRLAEVSRASGSGKLSLDFRSAVSGATDDPAVLFPLTGNRTATASISAGDTTAKFGPLSMLEFQTGTTSGTLLFTLQLGGYTTQASVTVTPAAVHIEGVRAMRTAGTLELRISGFDNTRSTSKLAFTFFDHNGTVVTPGQIAVDAGTAFHTYFGGSGAGGLFELRAVFPVSGPADQIDSAEIQLTNTVGPTSSQRTRF